MVFSLEILSQIFRKSGQHYRVIYAIKDPDCLLPTPTIGFSPERKKPVRNDP
jgi:hypothetical protein